MRLIELTGLPGSGKSTLLPIIKKYLRNRGFDLYDKQILILSCRELPLNKIVLTYLMKFLPANFREKIVTLFYRILDNKQAYMANYILENGKFSETIINNITESPLPLSKKKSLLLWWFNLIAIYQMAIESLEENSILVLDEGFYHKVINFFVHLNNDLEHAKIQSYVNSIPTIDILIHIQASLETCIERLKNRKLPRVIRGSTTPEVRTYLEKSKKAIEYSQNIIRTKGTNVIKIDNSTSPYSQEHIIDQLSRELDIHMLRQEQCEGRFFQDENTIHY